MMMIKSMGTSNVMTRIIYHLEDLWNCENDVLEKKIHQFVLFPSWVIRHSFISYLHLSMMCLLVAESHNRLRDYLLLLVIALLAVGL
jgi:hypothetical protein